jgi:hypothetical protein
MDKIDAKPGEIWVTRCGQEARIYATDGKGEYTIHGALLYGDEWQPFTWRENGTLLYDKASEHDIVRKHDWREELAPIWAVLKPEYKAIAMSQGGVWKAYTTKEVKPGSNGVWTKKYGYWASLECLNLPTPDCDWKDTLTVRP